MALKFSDVFQYLQYLPYLDRIVAIVHDITDTDSSKDKAADVITDVLDEVGPLVKAKNPGLSKELDAAIEVVKKALARYQDAPDAVPTPQPTTPDPTAARYENYDQALKATTPGNPLVLIYSDGRYGVWPNISIPSGAKQVN